LEDGVSFLRGADYLDAWTPPLARDFDELQAPTTGQGVSGMRLETERLIVRSWREADIGRYADIIGKRSVMRYIADGKPGDPASARSFVVGAIEDDRNGKPIFWAVESAATKELIGFCGFGRCDDQVDMGWRYDDRHWGMGYGSEAAKAVLAYGLNEFGFERVIARADPDNAGSIKIMRKLGFVFEREVSSNGIRRVIYAYSRTDPAR
jgi:RimJ/RimL family protein N-acetyltransferase